MVTLKFQNEIYEFCNPSKNYTHEFDEYSEVVILSCWNQMINITIIFCPFHCRMRFPQFLHVSLKHFSVHLQRQITPDQGESDILSPILQEHNGKNFILDFHLILMC
jgi:hypothetical protein